MTLTPTGDPAPAIRSRSFDHNGRIYDISASVTPTSSRTVVVRVTCNGHGVYYDYPGGVRTEQMHAVTFFGAIDPLHIETMNAVDYAMDDAERLVRAWVA